MVESIRFIRMKGYGSNPLFLPITTFTAIQSARRILNKMINFQLPPNLATLSEICCPRVRISRGMQEVIDYIFFLLHCICNNLMKFVQVLVFIRQQLFNFFLFHFIIWACTIYGSTFFNLNFIFVHYFKFAHCLFAHSLYRY